MSNENLAITSYETALGSVQLSPETVKQYLVRGNGTVTNEEVFLFIKTCEAQKLNPFVTGEVYLIKFGQQPAQMVIGYDTYKRRAEENPQYLFKESGIIVCRGQSGEIVQKQGACLYPTEKLIGGWCRVHKLKGKREVETYKEVGFAEYDKGNAIWKEKPCTMIEKVAISQCLREAFPKDYEGLYTEEELAPAEYEVITTDCEVVVAELAEDSKNEEIITQKERQELFRKAHDLFGKESGNELLKVLMEEEGYKSTSKMKRGAMLRIEAHLEEVYRNENQQLELDIDAGECATEPTS